MLLLLVYKCIKTFASPPRLALYVYVVFQHTQVRHESSSQSDLKSILSDLVPKKQAEVKEFRSQYGSKVVGEVTVDMVSEDERWLCTSSLSLTSSVYIWMACEAVQGP